MMTTINTPLFDNARIRFAPRDPARDAEIESRWTHDPDLSHLTAGTAARPLSADQVKNKYAEEAKDKRAFYFALRTLADDRLIGHVSLTRVHWTHGGAKLSLAIGEPADRTHGYGTEALHLVLRYAFEEMNLHRLSAVVYAFNPRPLEWLERFGFVVEVRSRCVALWQAQYWDALYLGLLRDEWKR